MLIDFHAHILPCVDHGSTSLESSIKQVEAAKDAGVDLIVATPHFYPDLNDLDSFLKRRNESYTELEPGLKKVGVKCILGAEVALCEGLENYEGLKNLCIEGTSCMLVEMPFRKINERLLNTLSEIRALGIIPVLAHIDRYDKEQVNQALDLGLKAQLNVDALSELFSRRKYLKHIDNGQVVTIGSDAHESRMNAYPKYSKALRVLGESRVEKLMQATHELLNI